MSSVGIVGGGLAGLVVAYRAALARRPGDRIVLFEASSRLGGQLWTENAGGVVVEHGAEGYVARSEAVPRLADDLGIGADIVGQLETRSFGFDDRGLVALAPGEAASFLGFQVARDDLGKGVRTFRRGMGQLADALAAALDGRVDVRRSTPVTSIGRAPGGLVVETPANQEPVDAVVVATPAAIAAGQLAGLVGERALALGAAATTSSCTVTLAYDRASVDHALDGTGFVVAASHQAHGFRACTFITSKLEGRAPPGVATFRVFYRPSDDDLATLPDEAWIERAHASLRRAVSIATPPSNGWVSRWREALPVFGPAHVARVRELEAALPAGVVLAGSAFHGSGIDAAVRSAEAAARAVIPSA